MDVRVEGNEVCERGFVTFCCYFMLPSSYYYYLIHNSFDLLHASWARHYNKQGRLPCSVHRHSA